MADVSGHGIASALAKHADYLLVDTAGRLAIEAGAIPLFLGGDHALAIELVRRLREPRAKLVLSHPAGDEGNAYMAMLNDRIADAGIDVRFIANRIGDTRKTNAQGKKVYTLSSV